MNDFWCLLFGHDFCRYPMNSHGPHVRMFTDGAGRRFIRCWRCGEPTQVKRAVCGTYGA